MNTKPTNLIWGIVLIALGGLLLAENLGYLGRWSPVMWVGIFGAVSLLFFVTYLVSGLQNWGWLFPACIFAGVAGTIYLSTVTKDAIVGAPVLASIAVPFLAAFAVDTRKHWWALIPAGVMLFVTLTTAIVDRARGEVIGAMLFFVIAFAFLAVYLLNRARLWALLVAYILGVLGFMPLMATTGRAELTSIVVMFAIALPFFVLYFRSPERWWAIIPAGILGTLGVVILIVLGFGIPGEGYDNSIPNALTFAGTAVTFAIVWLRHARHWAMWATALSALAAVAALFMGQRFQDYWPVIPIVIGLLLLYNTLRPKPV
jgi:hypothetical protein